MDSARQFLAEFIPVVMSEFPRATLDNIIAEIGDFYEAAAEKTIFKPGIDQVIPYINAHITHTVISASKWLSYPLGSERLIMMNDFESGEIDFVIEFNNSRPRTINTSRTLTSIILSCLQGMATTETTVFIPEFIDCAFGFPDRKEKPFEKIFELIVTSEKSYLTYITGEWVTVQFIWRCLHEKEPNTHKCQTTPP